MQEKIEFQQTRDFGEKLNATFSFITQNFKQLFQAILYISSPAILIGGFLYGKFMNMYTAIIRDAIGNPDNLGNMLGAYSEMGVYIIASIIFGLIAGTLVVCVVYSYITLYRENELEVIEVSDVWNRVKKEYFGIMGTLVLYYLTIIISYIIGLALIIPGSISNSPALIAVGAIVLIVTIFYLALGASFSFIIYMTEGSALKSIIKSLKIIRGKWWSTFGLLIVVMILQSILNYVFSIPMVAIMGIDMFTSIQDPSAEIAPTSEVFQTIAGIIYVAGVFMLYSLPLTAIAFQYFSLVESKEATGLMQKIDSMGEINIIDEEEQY